MTTCPSCGSVQLDGRKFCENCGVRLARTCDTCGSELGPDARFCGQCGSAQPGAASRAASTEPRWEDGTVAERKVTSVLFADLVGFTSLSESRDKEDVRELLSNYFEQCRRIVARYGGTIEKFIGDAVMAVWGVPAAHVDDAERSVRAGLDLVRAVEALGEDVGVPGLALRVGIVTAEVAVTLGAQHEGMVAGDAVNTASRVQSVAAPGSVWVDESTRLLTAAAITFSDVGSHLLKGKADPMPLWEARAVVAAVGGAQRADGLESPLVGRGRELRLIKELFHGVEETGRPALAVVEGEPGSGKTRLGWEVEKYVDGLSIDIAWHAGRCIGYGEGVAFWPIAEAVRGRLGLLDADLEADPINAVDAGLARYVPDVDEAEWLRPRLLVLLGRGTVATYDRDDLFAAWRTFFERTREDDPAVVLLVDDAQHADEGTLEFLEHLLINSAEPVFVVVMARPGLLERWSSVVTNRRSTVLHLAPLQQHEMAQLLDGLVTGLPAEIRDGLAERAEGIPLYAMETVRSLIDRDLVVPRGGVYMLADPERLNLSAIGAPPSLQALVAARLDGLPPAQRRTVQNASVLGTSFTREALAALCHGVDDLDGVLAELCRVEIFSSVSSRLSSEYGQYRFVQAIVRQIAYGTLSRRDRKARHVAAAEYFETVPDPGGDLAPVLAQHYLDAIDATSETDDHADLLERACRHLRRAATRARSLGSPAEALRYLELSIDFIGADAPADLHLEAARAAGEAGQTDAAIAHGEQACALSDAAGDPIGAGAAVAVIAWTFMVGRGDATRSVAIATPRWEALRGVPGAERVLLELAHALIRARHVLKETVVDLSVANIAVAEALGDRLALADTLVSFSLSLFRQAPVTSAMLLEAAIDIGIAEQRPSLLGRALCNLSALDSGTNLEVAVQHGWDGVAAGQKAGTAYIEGTAVWNLILALVYRGDWNTIDDIVATTSEEALSTCTLLLPVVSAVISRARGLPVSVAWSADELAGSDDERDTAYIECQRMLAAYENGALTNAAELGWRAAARWAEVEGYASDFTFLWLLALDVALAAADRATLDRLFALTDSIPHGIVPVGLRAHRLRATALVAIADGDSTDVEANLRAAVAAFDEWGSPPYRTRTQAELANWLTSIGRADDAAPLAMAALAHLQELGAHGWLAELGWAERAQPSDHQSSNPQSSPAPTPDQQTAADVP